MAARLERGDHEEYQGVLAMRFLERRTYCPASEPRPEGEDVYLVALVRVPYLPELPEGEADHDYITVVCAGRAGRDGKWGWMAIEKNTKQLLCFDLLNTVKAEVRTWYWLQIVKNWHSHETR